MKKLIIPTAKLEANSTVGAVISDGKTVTGLQSGTEYQAFNLDAGSEEFTPASQYTNAFAKAWAARLPVNFSDARASLFDQLFELINPLIPKSDVLYVMHGSEYREGARLNLIQDRFNLTEVGGENIEFSPDYGFRIKAGSSGALAQFLDTNLNFSTATNLKASLNNKTLATGAFSAIGGPSITGDANGTVPGGQGWTFFGLGNGSRLDSTVTRNSDGTSSTGHAALVRDNSANYNRYKDSVLLENIAVGSNPSNNSNFRLLTRGVATDGVPYSPMAYFYAGAALTLEEYQKLYYALNWFFSQLGAEPLAARTVQGSLSSV